MEYGEDAVTLVDKSFFVKNINYFWLYTFV